MVRAVLVLLASLHLLAGWDLAWAHGISPANPADAARIGVPDRSEQPVPTHDEAGCPHCQSARAVSPPPAHDIAERFVAAPHSPPIQATRSPQRLRARSVQPRAPPAD